jgi:hypothetical protein
MIEDNPFLRVGSLRSKGSSSSASKRSKESNKLTRQQRHRIKDFKLAKELGLKVWELR